MTEEREKRRSDSEIFFLFLSFLLLPDLCMYHRRERGREGERERGREREGERERERERECVNK